MYIDPNLYIVDRQEELAFLKDYPVSLLSVDSGMVGMEISYVCPKLK